MDLRLLAREETRGELFLQIARKAGRQVWTDRALANGAEESMSSVSIARSTGLPSRSAIPRRQATGRKGSGNFR